MFLVRAMERGGDQNDASPLLQAGLILESLGKFEEAAVRFTYITSSADALQWLAMGRPRTFGVRKSSLDEPALQHRASLDLPHPDT